MGDERIRIIRLSQHKIIGFFLNQRRVLLIFCQTLLQIANLRLQLPNEYSSGMNIGYFVTVNHDLLIIILEDFFLFFVLFTMQQLWHNTFVTLRIIINIFSTTLNLNSRKKKAKL